MRKDRFAVTGIAAALCCFVSCLAAQAQSASTTPAQPQEKCLRALDGSCTNPAMVEAARLRAVIIPSVRVSYFGTPAGTVGGNYITYERFFQDNELLFGLPTSTLTTCVLCRTK
jgi:hypothetical protein